jgi:hypothetical protein
MWAPFPVLTRRQQSCAWWLFETSCSDLLDFDMAYDVKKRLWNFGFCEENLVLLSASEKRPALQWKANAVDLMDRHHAPFSRSLDSSGFTL